MRVATVDGLVTLFYDGSKPLYNRELHIEWSRACNQELQQRNREQRELRKRQIHRHELDFETLDLSAEWSQSILNRSIPFRGRRVEVDRLLNGGNHAEDTADIESLNLSDECYLRERLSWQQVIVVEGVTEIPERTFWRCFKIKRVIFADTVIRVKEYAFFDCKSLVFIKWSLRLEYIGEGAFRNCNLSSVFIPPRCRQIRHEAFAYNRNLTILNIPQDTELEAGIIKYTELRERYSLFNDGPLSTWLKNINHNDQFDLHRVCSSFESTLDVILDTMIRKGGPKAFRAENGIGINPSRYLKENPYADIKEKDIIEKYILQMMGKDSVK